jgi:hypothetical protein
MPDVKDLYDVAFDREQDAIDVWSTTVEQLANFYACGAIFRCEGAA